ncbi:hypothetical protein AALA79_01770 [Lachnospiraceae bacterium 64-25]
MARLTVKQIQRRLDEVNERLEYYLSKEREILSESGVASYTIGSRSVSRYQYSADINKNIKELQTERDELENLLAGIKPRAVLGVVPQDW